MLRPNLVSFIESEMALPTFSNKLIEKQNLNFLPLRKFEIFREFFEIFLQEQTKWISSRNFEFSTKLNQLQIQLTDIHHLGCPKNFRKSDFSSKLPNLIGFQKRLWNALLSPQSTCHQRVTKFCIQRENFAKFNFSGTRNRFWNANENYSTSKIEIYLQTETQSVLIRLLMSHHMSH